MMLEAVLKPAWPEDFKRNTEIVCASLGNDAGLIGAAML